MGVVPHYIVIVKMYICVCVFVFVCVCCLYYKHDKGIHLYGWALTRKVAMSKHCVDYGHLGAGYIHRGVGYVHSGD